MAQSRHIIIIIITKEAHAHLGGLVPRTLPGSAGKCRRLSVMMGGERGGGEWRGGEVRGSSSALLCSTWYALVCACVCVERERERGGGMSERVSEGVCGGGGRGKATRPAGWPVGNAVDPSPQYLLGHCMSCLRATIDLALPKT